eukprot:1357495-Amphidinium_carterae.2
MQHSVLAHVVNYSGHNPTFKSSEREKELNVSKQFEICLLVSLFSLYRRALGKLVNSPNISPWGTLVPFMHRIASAASEGLA